MSSEGLVARILKESDAVITGTHVVFTSGKHGDAYVNKDAIYPAGGNIRALCEEIAKDFAFEEADVVVGPVQGATVLAFETANCLSEMNHAKVLWAYAEKEQIAIPDPEGKSRKVFVETGNFVLKRGYDELVKGKRVLIVEDVLTTGGSVKKVVELVRSLGGEVIGVAALVNRGGVTAEMIGNPEKFLSLQNIKMAAWEEPECPLCKEGVPINTRVGKGREYLAKKAAAKAVGA